MGKNLKRFFLSVGLVLYIGSDIYVAVQHWKNDEPWWFGLTVGFICVPSIIVNFAAIIQTMNIWTCTTAFAQLSIVARYLEAIVEPDAKSGAFSRTYLLAILRYIETITESAPQLCLQVYIMLRQQSFPLYTLISSVISMLSLTWSVITLENERRKEEGRDFTCIETFFFLIWQLFTFMFRLPAIALFAYAFRYYVIILLAAHWLIVAVTIFLTEICATGDVGKSFLLSILAAFPFLFHSTVSPLPIERDKLVTALGYSLLWVASTIMLILSNVYSTYPQEGSIVRVWNIYAYVIYGTFFIVFMIVYDR